MKKTLAFVMFIVLLLGLSGCNQDVTITLPFEVTDVESIESYYDDGMSSTVQKKTTTKSTDIEELYTFFTELSLQDKDSSSSDCERTARFVFILSDGTSYELVYVNEAVKKGRLMSPSGEFDYFTSADLCGVWEGLSGEIESIVKDNTAK